MESTDTVTRARVTDLADLADGALLSEAMEIEALLREAEVHKLRIAYQWAIAHPALDACETPSGPALPSVLTAPETLGGAGTPAVAAFTPEPLAVALGCTPASASALLADALDLHHRLPLLWDQTRAQLVPAWKASRVATRTRHLSAEAARWVDRQVAGRVSSLSVPALDRLVAEGAARCDGEDHAAREAASRLTWDVVLVQPDPHRYTGTSELRAIGDHLDLTRFHDVVCAEAEARLDLTTLVHAPDPEAHEQARRHAVDRRDAKVRLYLHASLADVVAGDSRATGSAEALGPVTLDLVRAWAGPSRVTIQPVLHVAADDRWSVDRHDPPPRMAEEVRLRDETCIFPWCGRSARQCDLDHRESFEDPGDGGPPGQTSTESIAPLRRRHHRAKTSGSWSYERVGPGTYLWSGPSGLSVLATPRGTVAIPRS